MSVIDQDKANGKSSRGHTDKECSCFLVIMITTAGSLDFGKNLHAASVHVNFGRKGQNTTNGRVGNAEGNHYNSSSDNDCCTCAQVEKCQAESAEKARQKSASRKVQGRKHQTESAILEGWYSFKSLPTP